MKSTKSKVSKKGEMIVSAGRTYSPEALKKFRQYQTKYEKENYRRISLRIRSTETELIEWLESQENVMEYIRSVVKADMIRQKKKLADKQSKQ